MFSYLFLFTGLCPFNLFNHQPSLVPSGYILGQRWSLYWSDWTMQIGYENEGFFEVRVTAVKNAGKCQTMPFEQREANYCHQLWRGTVTLQLQLMVDGCDNCTLHCLWRASARYTITPTYFYLHPNQFWSNAILMIIKSLKIPPENIATWILASWAFSGVDVSHHYSLTRKYQQICTSIYQVSQ